MFGGGRLDTSGLSGKWLLCFNNLVNKQGPQFSAVNLAKFRGPVHKILQLTAAKLSQVP